MKDTEMLAQPTRRKAIYAVLALGIGLAVNPITIAPAAEQNARTILKGAFQNWRADTSHATVKMLIKRSNGTRSMTLESWTKGEKTALVRFTAPARDAGNATLQLGNSTYVFNPQLNQVIKLPASAMSQSWMGSDFSYNDLSRSDKVVDDYTHKLIATKSSGGKKLYVIESTPKRGKPIVWGKQILSIRADGILFSVEYFDQLGKRVRIMTADKISNLGGRPYPTVLTMKIDAKPGQFTRVTTTAAEFNVKIPSYVFTKSNLQYPRD